MRKKLKLFRVGLGMSQEQFSVKIGYSRGQYARIEHGERNVTLKFLNALCKAFDMTITEAQNLTVKDEE